MDTISLAKPDFFQSRLLRLPARTLVVALLAIGLLAIPATPVSDTIQNSVAVSALDLVIPDAISEAVADVFGGSTADAWGWRPPGWKVAGCAAAIVAIVAAGGAVAIAVSSAGGAWAVAWVFLTGGWSSVVGLLGGTAAAYFLADQLMERC